MIYGNSPVAPGLHHEILNKSMKTVLLIVVVVVTPFSFAGNELWVDGSDIVKGGDMN